MLADPEYAEYKPEVSANCMQEADSVLYIQDSLARGFYGDTKL
jgi:hypothetical protein